MAHYWDMGELMTGYEGRLRFDCRELYMPSQGAWITVRQGKKKTQ